MKIPALVEEKRLVRDGYLPILERDGTNQLQSQYAWGLNLGGGIGGLFNLSQNSQDYGYLYDGKGNVTAVIDSTQQPVASYGYDAFGKLLSESGTLEPAISVFY